MFNLTFYMEMLLFHSFLFFKVFLPLNVELLESLFSNLNIVLELALLNVVSEFVLVRYDFGFKKANFPHQVLV